MYSGKQHMSTHRSRRQKSVYDCVCMCALPLRSQPHISILIFPLRQTKNVKRIHLSLVLLSFFTLSSSLYFSHQFSHLTYLLCASNRAMRSSKVFFITVELLGNQLHSLNEEQYRAEAMVR